MQNKGSGLSQTTLLLRLLCGCYLVYLGISLLAEGAETAFFAIAAAVFILVGGGLALFSLRTGLRDWKKNASEDSDGADESEE